MPTDAEWAWFAGLFDGEGAVTVHVAGKPPATIMHRGKLAINMTDEDTLARVRALFGGYIGKVQNTRVGRACWVWQSSGRDAAELARNMTRYSVTKRRRLEFIVQLYDEWPPRQQVGIAPAEFNRRQRIRDEILRINDRTNKNKRVIELVPE
jgi:hypothetical protein